MSDKSWYYVLHGTKPVNFTGSDGTPRRYSTGDTFGTDDVCEMANFVKAVGDQTNDGARENHPGAFRRLDKAVAEANCGGGSGAVTPTPGATNAPTNVNPGAEGDTPSAQGAPDVVTAGTMKAPPKDESPSDKPPQGESSPLHSGEQSRQPPLGGDPVDLFAGTLRITEVDLEVATSVLPLHFVRRYRSGPSHRGPFGWNWDHNHNVYLRELNDGSVARWTGRLNEDIFVRTGAHFAPPRGVFESLEEDAAGPHRYVVRAAGGVSWSFRRPGGWTDVERIPLVEIRDRHGNRLRYTYDASGRVAEVRDDDDRGISFRYGECGLLEAISDHAGRTVLFLHDGDAQRLVCVRAPLTPDQPEGATRTYAYASPHAHPALAQNIMRVTDANGDTYLQNEYDTDPTSWSFGRVKRQLYADREYHYQYDGLQYAPPRAEFLNTPTDRTLVFDPDGTLTTYTFNYRGDVLDHRTRLSRDGSYRVLVTTFGYDSQGNTVRITMPDGLEELTVYDDANPDPRMRGRPTRREMTARAGFPAPSRIVWRAEYEPTYQLIRKERTESGAETRYVYDFDLAAGPGTSGRLAEIHHPAAVGPGGVAQHAVTRFETDPQGRVTATTSPTGVREEREYGPAGPHAGLLVLRRSDAGGLALEHRYSYNAFGHLSEVVEPTGAVSTTDFDARGRVVRRRVPDVGGLRGEHAIHYDGESRVVGIQRPLGAYAEPSLVGSGLHDEVERDVLGNPRRVVFNANTGSPREYRLCHDHEERPVRIADAEGRVQQLRYDERGLLLRRTTFGNDDAIDAVRFVYDVAGRLQQRLDGASDWRSTRYEYDAFGRLMKVESPTGARLTYVWGKDDRLVEERADGDPGDGSTRTLWRRRYEHDARGRTVREIEASFREDPNSGVELVTQHEYDADDRLVLTVDPRGGRTEFQYDGVGRVVRVADPMGNVRTVVHDDLARSRTTTFLETSPGGVITRSRHEIADSRGRVVEMAEAGSKETRSYDDRDLPVADTRVDGVRVLRAFDASGFLESEVHDAGGLGVLNRWKRNDRGDTTSYIDPTQEVTTYAYDGIGRSVSIIEPGGAGSTLSYSPEGLVAEEEVSGGVVLNYGHSDAGLTASVESTASPSVAPLPKHEYEYDALGRLVRARRPGSDISRVYDSQGRLVRESHNGFQCEIRYDDLAGVIERHWPDGRVERQFVDLNGFTTRIDVTAAGVLGEGPATLASYAAQGPSRPDSGELRTVAPFTFAYDERARLVAQSYAGPGGINESCAYRYDSAGRRRVTRHEQAPALVRYHGFDTRDRLLLAAEEFAGPPLGSGRSQGEHDAAIADYASASATAAIMREFEYDASDTRTRAREAGAADVVYAQSAGHRLTAAGAETFTYHDIGTRKSDASRKFDVDAVGRVIAVRDHAGGLRASLEYDALGRPWRVTDATGRVREYRYFGDELWQEDADGQPIRQFTPHPFFPRCSLAVHRESKTYALLHDAVGTMIGAIDGAGAVVERYRYRPFGLPSIYGPDGTPRQQSLVGIEPVFAGMRYLPEVELYLTKARLMDPVHGVFLSIDPMGHRDSPNPYAYAAQNPIDLIDPDGELAFLGFLVIVGVGALVAGGMNAVRQGAQMIDDPEKEFSWGELAVSAGLGGALAPVLVVAPELAVPLAGYGVASGVSELAQGNITTGSFDIATSVLPFGSKGVRKSVLGRASARERFGRFGEVGRATADRASRLWSERFYHGNTEDSINAALADIHAHLDFMQVAQRYGWRQRGPGLYFTRSPGDPSIPGSAAAWAQRGGMSGRGGAPAILEARIPRVRLRQIRRDPGVKIDRSQHLLDAPESHFPFDPSPGFPGPGPARAFANAATWSRFDPNAANPTFSALWPLLATPRFTPPTAANASPADGESVRSTEVGTKK